MKKILVIMVVLLFMAGNLYSENVPAMLQVRLILKILSMDDKIDRFGDTIKIGVSSDLILNAFKSASDMKVKGKPFTVGMLASPGDIGKFNVIYADSNWSGNYAAAASKAASSGILMFCNEEAGISSGLGAIAFKVIDGKPKILVNIDNAKKQGSEFPANFLKMALLVK